MPTPVRRRPKDRRQQILRAAYLLFSEHGYSSVSMARIAARVGIAPSALYRHFPHKAGLLAEVFRERFGEFDEASVTSLEAAFTQAIRNAVRHQGIAALWARDAQHLPEEVQAEVRSLLRSTMQTYRRLLRAERPELSESQAEFLARAIQSTYRVAADSDPTYPEVRLVSGLRGLARHLVTVELVAEGEAVAQKRSGLRPSSRREQVLAVATQLFSEHGYQDTSMAQVAAAMGVTGPNLYQYFDDKAALLRAVIERATHALWIDLWTILAQHRTPAEALPDVVRSYVTRMSGWSPRALLTTGDAEVTDFIREGQREYTQEWIRLLQETRPALNIRQASFMVRAAMSVVDTLSRTPSLRQDPGFEENLNRIALHVLELVPFGPFAKRLLPLDAEGRRIGDDPWDRPRD